MNTQGIPRFPRSIVRWLLPWLTARSHTTATVHAPPMHTQRAAPQRVERRAGIKRPPKLSQEPPSLTLDASLSIGIFGRDLAYFDDLFGKFRPYSLSVAPSIRSEFELYPLAFTRSPWLAAIGVTGSGEFTFGLSSSDTSGRRYETSAYSYAAGLKFRVPVRAFELALAVQYAGRSFRIDNTTSENDPGIPGVHYQSIRFSPSVRWNVSTRVGLIVSAGYLAIVSAGELGSQAYFPRMWTGSVEASVTAALSLGHGLEARLSLEGQRYFASMNPEPGDLYVVGGMLDHYYRAGLAIAYRH